MLYSRQLIQKEHHGNLERLVFCADPCLCALGLSMPGTCLCLSAECRLGCKTAVQKMHVVFAHVGQWPRGTWIPPTSLTSREPDLRAGVGRAAKHLKGSVTTLSPGRSDSASGRGGEEVGMMK